MERKPILFESACLFSILGSSLAFLYMLFAALFFHQMQEIVIKYSNLGSAEHISPLFFAILMAAYSVSLAGVIKLYRMQRSGLYLYLAAQVMILLIPLSWIGSEAFSVTNIIFTLLFSGIYLYYYRQLT